jgi:hypothetical protein
MINSSLMLLIFANSNKAGRKKIRVKAERKSLSSSSLWEKSQQKKSRLEKIASKRSI